MHAHIQLEASVMDGSGYMQTFHCNMVINTFCSQVITPLRVLWFVYTPDFTSYTIIKYSIHNQVLAIANNNVIMGNHTFVRSGVHTVTSVHISLCEKPRFRVHMT